MAERIDGKAVAESVRENVGAAVKTLPGQPTLAVVLVGEDPASQVYVRNKVLRAAETGIRSIEPSPPHSGMRAGHLYGFALFGRSSPTTPTISGIMSPAFNSITSLTISFKDGTSLENLLRRS